MCVIIRNTKINTITNASSISKGASLVVDFHEMGRSGSVAFFPSDSWCIMYVSYIPLHHHLDTVVGNNDTAHRTETRAGQGRSADRFL